MDERATVRPAALTDAPDIARIHVASWLETYGEILPQEMLATLSVAQRTITWEQILQDPRKHDDSSVHLIEVGGTMAGFGACGAQRNPNLLARGYDAEISSIYILQLYQRRGMGLTLMRAMTNDLLTRGFKGVALWVLSKNVAARRFYACLAGEVVAEKEDVRANVVLNEVAYGWQSIEDLLKIQKSL